MIVITLTDCPPKLRGDLSKWMIEINTGVFVGNMSARVRDELWQRICDNLKHGRATLVHSSSGEQRMKFRVHNTSWELIDYDGLTLMRHPSEKRLLELKNSARQTDQADIPALNVAGSASAYTVIDLETNGLKAGQHSIIEFGALRVRDHLPVAEFSALVKSNAHLSEEISRFTGLTDAVLESEGLELSDALNQFLDFVGTDLVVCHNAVFDYSFLRYACKQCSCPVFNNPSEDTLKLARRKILLLENYKLTTLAEHFSLTVGRAHRALADCHLTYEVFEKLNEI